MPWPEAQSALGLVVLTFLAWMISENRRAFPWALVVVGIGLQIVLAVILLKIPPLRDALFSLTVVVDGLMRATQAGSGFVFGYIGGAAPPFAVADASKQLVIAFQVLPLVLVVSALSALLWHWRVLPIVIGGFAWALQRTMGIGGAVGVGTAANVFMGMVEAPLLIRPYISKLSRSELFVVFTVGLATVSGTVMALYAAALGPIIPGAAGHVLVASLISLPAAILISKVMIPGVDLTPAHGDIGEKYASSMDAIARGTRDGLDLFLQIIAMLIVVIALVALLNQLLGLLPPTGGAPITFERIIGLIFAPLVWLFGVPWEEAMTAGALMGTKTVINEFVAYLNMAALPEGALSPRSELIMLYAMCGFANFGSVGMVIAAVGAMAPERRSEIADLSIKSLISGTLATGMTGSVIGLIPI